MEHRAYVYSYIQVDVRYMGCRAGRVGKVSGIEVSGRVLGIKQPFECPKCTMSKTINRGKLCLKIVYSNIIEVADSESDLSLCN